MEPNHTTFCRYSIVAATVTAVSALFIAGCGPKEVRTIGSGVAPKNGHISKEDVREQLDNFAEFFKATLRQTANELNERLNNQRTQKITLQMRARMAQGLNAMLEQDDPIVAFIETWALCTRFRTYLTEGEGSTLYGDAQELAVAAAQRLEAEAERIGHAFLKDDTFEASRKNIAEFAQGNPIKGTFSNVVVYATELKKGQPNPFVSVLMIPMSPFRAMEGVDRTAEAVHKFRDTAERFSDTVRELPESSRWQLQLLLYDLEETDMAKSFLNSFAQLSQSSERLSKSVEQLPQQMGEQLTKFVEEIDANQANIQKTFGQAEKTTLAVNDALEKLDKVVASLNSAAKDVTETAAAWENAAKATGEVAREFNKPEESPKEGPSFNIGEYRSAAEQTSQAANDIKELLAAVDEFSKSRNYTSVINALTLRAIGLVLLIFALAVVYRIIASRLARARGDRAA